MSEENNKKDDKTLMLELASIDFTQYGDRNNLFKISEMALAHGAYPEQFRRCIERMYPEHELIGLPGRGNGYYLRKRKVSITPEEAMRNEIEAIDMERKSIEESILAQQGRLESLKERKIDIEGFLKKWNGGFSSLGMVVASFPVVPMETRSDERASERRKAYLIARRSCQKEYWKKNRDNIRVQQKEYKRQMRKDKPWVVHSDNAYMLASKGEYLPTGGLSKNEKRAIRDLYRTAHETGGEVCMIVGKNDGGAFCLSNLRVRQFNDTMTSD